RFLKAFDWVARRALTILAMLCQTMAHLPSRASQLAAIMLSSVIACRATTGLPERDVEVALVSDTSLAYVDDATIELGIQVVLRNHDRRDVFLSRCGHFLQRRTPVGWETTLSVPCIHASNALVVSPNTGGIVGLGLRA